MQQAFGNRFKVVSILGEGGMGTVYRVHDALRSDEEIALKLLRRNDQGLIGSSASTGTSGSRSGKLASEQRLRFKEEFRAMTRLRHPNTIDVYDYGQLDDETPFITMEVIPGHELAEVIAEGPLALDRLYPLLIQLLQALEFIHSRMLVHRDIKSQNIRVRPDGLLKLMDYGLMSPRGVLTRGGSLTGSPGYVAPEVIRGGVIDAATDLYGVGCLAYELICGRLPFTGRVIEVVRAHAATPPPPLRQWRADVPPRLEQIVMRLLEKDQSARYQQAGEVIADLAQLSGLSVARQNIDQKRSYLTTSALVGRKKELAELAEALEGVRDGAGAAVFVGGPAGVGKSRLLEEFLVQAKLEAVMVLQGRAEETGMAPYEVAAGSLRPLLTASPAATVERLGPVLIKLFPELARLGVQPLPAGDPEHENLRLNEAVAEWLAELSRRAPVIWAIDNPQWADANSLAIFNHCIRRQGEMRVLFLAAPRDEDVAAGHPLRFTLEEGLSRPMRLDALDVVEMRGMLSGMLHAFELSDAFEVALFNMTGGNPYFLAEAVRYLMEAGVLVQTEGVWRFPEAPASLDLPSSAEETLLRRLAHLSEGARDIAGVAAVVGRQVQRDMLLTLSGLDEDMLFDHLDELITHQIMTREDDRLVFTHDQARHVLYRNLRPVTKRMLHQVCAHYLEEMYGEETPTIYPELAFHHARGADKRRAFRYLRLAAEQAEAAGAEATAIGFLQGAAKVLDGLDIGAEKTELQLEIWWELGFAAFLLVPHVAIEALGRMRALLEAQPELDPDGHRLLGVYNILANAYGFAGRPREGLAMVHKAEALLPGTDSLFHGAMRVVSCASLISAGRYDEVLAIARQAEAVLWARDLTDDDPPPVYPARVGALAAQNAVSYQGVRPDEGLRDRALEAALAIGDEEPFTVRQFFGIWFAWTGRYEEATAYVEQALAKCRKLGAPPYLWALYLKPFLAHQRGAHEEALGLIEQAVRYPHLAQNAFALQLLHVLHGEVLSTLGDREAATRVLESAERSGRADDLALVTLRALLAKASHLASLGEAAAARSAAGEALGMALDGPTRNPLHEAIARRLLGELDTRAGRLDEAAADLAKALAIAERPEQDNPIEQARTHLALARLAQVRGESALAGERLSSARALFESLSNVYGLALVEEARENPLAPGAGAEAWQPAAEGLHMRMMNMMGGMRG